MFGGYFQKITEYFNKTSGMGGSGDMSGADAGLRARIPSYQIANLLRTNPILRRSMEAVPEDIIRAWRIFEDNDAEWQDVEDSFDVEETMEKALYWAGSFGGALILPRYDERVVSFKSLAKPAFVPPAGSLLGFRVFRPDELCDYVRVKTDRKRQDCGLPEIFAIKDECRRDPVAIHHTWTIPMFGAFSSEDKYYSHHSCEAMFGDSGVDAIFDDLTRDQAGLIALSHLLAKSNVDTLSITGLGEALNNCTNSDEANRVIQQAQARAMTGIQHSSIYQPMIIDESETLQRHGLDASGATDMSKALTDRFVAATGIPRTRILGEQAKGLSNGGDIDLKWYYDKVASIRRRRCKKPFRSIDAVLSNDTGATVPAWKYGELWQQTEKERAETEKFRAETDERYVRMDMPFARSKIAHRLDKNETYDFTEDELSDIDETDGVEE